MSRSQLVYRAVAPDQGPEEATVIALHGRNGTLDDLVPLASSLGPAVGVFAPEAARGVYDGLELVSHTWFGLRADGEPEPASFGDSLFQLEQFVYDVVDRADGQGRLPFVLGYDYGAVLALAAATVIPDFLAGVMAVGGHLPTIPGWDSPVERADGLAVLLVGDAADRDSARRLRQRGAEVTTVEVDGAHLLGDEVAATLRQWLSAVQLREA
jgi:predicted esterase